MNKKYKNQIVESLNSKKLCKWCIGRLFESDPLQVEKTGTEIAEKYNIRLYDKECEICRGFFYNIRQHVNDAANYLQKEDIEYDSFYVGLRVPRDVLDVEDELRANLKSFKGMNIKRYANYILSRLLSEKLRKRIDNIKPDILVTFNLNGYISVEISPLYIVGCYVKHEAEIDHSPTTKQKRSSITLEDILKNRLLELFKAEDIRFAWTGTDGYGVTVAGSGRPFFAKIIKPRLRKRWIKNSLNQMARDGVALTLIRLATRKELDDLARRRFFDLIKVKVRLTGALTANNDEIIRVLENEFNSRTITLARPRGTRYKLVRFLRVNRLEKNSIELTACIEHGFDIRKLFSCKDVIAVTKERAHPSLGDILGVVCDSLEYKILTVSEDCDYGFI